MITSDDTFISDDDDEYWYVIERFHDDSFHTNTIIAHYVLKRWTSQTRISSPVLVATRSVNFVTTISVKILS